MFTVQKFLWFMDLESGVNLIGYCGIFMSLILAITFLLTSAFNIHEVLNYLSTRFAVHHKTDLPAVRKFCGQCRDCLWFWVNADRFLSLGTIKNDEFFMDVNFEWPSVLHSLARIQNFWAFCAACHINCTKEVTIANIPDSKVTLKWCANLYWKLPY